MSMRLQTSTSHEESHAARQYASRSAGRQAPRAAGAADSARLLRETARLLRGTAQGAFLWMSPAPYSRYSALDIHI